MNISYNNGGQYYGPYDEKKFNEALTDPDVVSARIYKPGAIVEMSDRKYRVGNGGNLIRMREK